MTSDTRHALVPHRPDDATARPVSGIERIWISAERLAPGFFNHMVVEGDGALDADRLRDAVDAAAQANPGARVVLRGALGWSSWKPVGPPPEVVELEAGAWDGQSDRGAAFWGQGVALRRGPTCAVLWSPGERSRVVFRTHHSVMDGVGTRLFAYDVFRALRGERCVGAQSGPVHDMALLGDAAKPPAQSPGAERYVSPTGASEAEPGATGYIWARATVASPGRRVMARALAALVGASASPEAACSVSIPVDLRRRQPKLRSTANLTSMLTLVCEDPAAKSDLADYFHREVRANLQAGTDLSAIFNANALRWIPVGLVHRGLRSVIQSCRDAGRFLGSAVVSNLGLQRLSDVTAPGFTPSAVFWIPPPSLTAPLFVTLSGHDAGLELLATASAQDATRARLERFVSAMATSLETGG